MEITVKGGSSRTFTFQPKVNGQAVTDRSQLMGGKFVAGLVNVIGKVEFCADSDTMLMSNGRWYLTLSPEITRKLAGKTLAWQIKYCVANQVLSDKWINDAGDEEPMIVRFVKWGIGDEQHP